MSKLPGRSPFGPAPFDGKRFSNLSGRGQHGFSALPKWILTRHRGAWPPHVANDPAPKPAERVSDGTIRATSIGHSTVLLQVAGLNILTDPVWSPRVGPTSWLGVKRSRRPALSFDRLPKIDVVLLSHSHYDHLDRSTLRALALRDDPLVLTGLKVGSIVPSERVVELDWWQSHPLPNRSSATYVPAEHFSARGPFDRNVTLWGGFVLETPAGAIYFVGDTGHGAHFAAVRERFGPMRLSFIPIGAYEPRWFMAPVHIDPAEAVAASMILESEVSIAIHFGTFQLADDGFEAPAKALHAALAAQGRGVRGTDFRLPTFGAPIVLAP